MTITFKDEPSYPATSTHVLSKVDQSEGVVISGSRLTCPHGVMLGLCSTSFNPRGLTCKKCDANRDYSTSAPTKQR